MARKSRTTMNRQKFDEFKYLQKQVGTKRDGSTNHAMALANVSNATWSRIKRVNSFDEYLAKYSVRKSKAHKIPVRVEKPKRTTSSTSNRQTKELRQPDNRLVLQAIDLLRDDILQIETRLSDLSMDIVQIKTQQFQTNELLEPTEQRRGWFGRKV